MFKPTHHDVALWRMVYRLAEGRRIGDIITYSELNAVLKVDVNKNRGSIYRANKELMKARHGMLEVARGKGYKLIEGMDIFHHAQKRMNRAFPPPQFTHPAFSLTDDEVTKLKRLVRALE